MLAPFLSSTLAGAALAAAALAAPLASQAANVTLQDARVQVGVNTFGTLGSGGSATPGMAFDPSATSTWQGNDWLTPSRPEEGFVIASADARTWEASNARRSSFTQASPTLLPDGRARWQGLSLDGVLEVTQTVALTTRPTASLIDITTTLLNLGPASLDGLVYMRFMDPDPDADVADPLLATYDTVQSKPDHVTVCATGRVQGETLCMQAQSEAGQAGIRALAAGAEAAPWGFDARRMLAGQIAGGDALLGLAFALDPLASGQSVTLQYRYAAAADLAGAEAGLREPDAGTGGQPVPEPASVALAVLALGAAAWLQRRR